MINKKKIEQLIDSLKKRNNKAYKFFEIILQELENDNTKDEAIRKLSSCFSITQYSNFDSEEEELLSEIIDEI